MYACTFEEQEIIQTNFQIHRPWQPVDITDDINESDSETEESDAENDLGGIATGIRTEVETPLGRTVVLDALRKHCENE